MEYQPKGDNSTSEGEDTLDWNSEDMLEHAKMMFQLKEKIYEKAGTNIKKAQEIDTMYYDKKHSDLKVVTAYIPEHFNEHQTRHISNSFCLQVFTPGTLVLMRNSQRDSKKGDKLKARWLGPYKVHEALGKGVYRLENLKGVVLKATVNQCRLKLYHTTKATKDTDQGSPSDSDDESPPSPPPKKGKVY